MKEETKTLIFPILIITIGVGWLLTTQGVAPEINWLWTLALAVSGVVVFVVSGWNKFSAVVGPFFLVSSCFAVLRQTGRLDVNTEVPLLVIIVGVLLLVARSSAIPMPDWMDEPNDPPA